MAMLLLVSSLGIGVLAESRASKQTAIRTEEAAQEYVQQYAREISAGKTEYSVTGGQRLESFSDKKKLRSVYSFSVGLCRLRCCQRGG